MDGLLIRLLTAHDIDEAMNVTFAVHNAYNPPVASLGFGPEARPTGSREAFASVINSGYSYGAFDNDKLVACRFCYIRHKTDGNKTVGKTEDDCSNLSKSDYYATKFDEMTEMLEKKADIFNLYNVDKAMHFYGMSVVEGYKQRGLATEMTSYAMSKARKLGISCFFTRATGAFSSRVFAKLGFEKLAEIDYKDFIGKDGKSVFTADPPHNSIIYWGKYFDKEDVS